MRSRSNRWLRSFSGPPAFRGMAVADVWLVDVGNGKALKEALEWGRRRRAVGQSPHFVVKRDSWRESLHRVGAALAAMEPTDFSSDLNAEIERADIRRCRRRDTRRALIQAGFAVSRRR